MTLALTHTLAASLFEPLPWLWPEIALFGATCIVMVLGLSPNLRIRRLCAPVAGVGLAIAGLLAAFGTPEGRGVMPGLIPFAKTVIAAVGLLLLLLVEGTVD